MSIIFMDTDGGRLAMEVEGDGPLIICSPGVGDTRDAFAPLASRLVARGYRVARIDLRGHGDSTAGFGHFGDEATASDFLTAIDALGGGPAVLAGASLSAAAAVIAAGREPDQIAGLVLLGPFLRNATGPVMRWITSAALSWPWGPTIWRGYAAKLWPGLGDEASGRAASTIALLKRPGHWAAFHRTITTDHCVVAPWLDRVRAPVLVVMGDADPDWKDPIAEAKWVASNFADVETVAVPRAGHAPMFERPEIVSPAVIGFLEKISRSGAFKPSNA